MKGGGIKLDIALDPTGSVRNIIERHARHAQKDRDVRSDAYESLPPHFSTQGDCVNTQHEQRDGLAKKWDKISTEKTGRKMAMDEDDHRVIFFGLRHLV